MGLPDFLTIKLYSAACCAKGCDALIIVPNEVDDQFRKSRESFYCYRGHSQSYSGLSKEEKLKKELTQMTEYRDNAVKRKEWAQQAEKKAEYQRRAAKGQLTKIKKRIIGGVCPCCNRQFVKLRDHMKSEHPNYAKEKS